jgi:ethanolamine utilization protein EutN
MRIAKIIGTVTLNRSLASFTGARLKLAVPLSLDDLTNQTQRCPDFEVVWDDLGAGMGSRIAMSEGPEAAKPFRPEPKPVNAYNAAILDHVDIQMTNDE